MLPILVTVEELGQRCVIVTDDDIDWATEVLEDVSTLVRSLTGRTFVDEAGALLPDIPDAVITVVKKAAKRAYENPKGFASEQVGQYGYRRDSGSSELTKSERSMLRLAYGLSNVTSVQAVVDGVAG